MQSHHTLCLNCVYRDSVSINLRSGISGFSGYVYLTSCYSLCIVFILDAVADISLSLAYSECNLFFYNCSTIVTKPRVLAHMIRNKFGSADNISSMRKLYFCYLNKQVNCRGSFLHQASSFRVNWTGSYHDQRLRDSSSIQCCAWFSGLVGLQTLIEATC